jgi:hypothetical protein
VAEVEPGIVSHEFNRHQSNQEAVESLREDAEALLAAQAGHPADLKARSWDELGGDEQAALGDELLEIPRFGLMYVVQDVMASGLAIDPSILVTDALKAYHHTLPFSDGELNWLFDAHLDAVDKEMLDGYSIVEWIMDQSGEVVVLGQRHTASGAELIRREWDWMRGAGEYEGNSTYDNATKAALQGIVNLFDDRG